MSDSGDAPSAPGLSPSVEPASAVSALRASPPIADEHDTYNDGYTHEALHTCFVLMETFSDHVLDTPCADEFPDVKAAADRALDAMMDVYQLIGRKFSDDWWLPARGGSGSEASSTRSAQADAPNPDGGEV